MPGARRIIGDSAGFLKLLFRREDMKLLGVHVMGEQATEIVHIGMMAMLAGATADMFDEACFNLPSLSVLYKSATFDAMLHASRPSGTRPPRARVHELRAGSGPSALGAAPGLPWPQTHSRSFVPFVRISHWRFPISNFKFEILNFLTLPNCRY